MTIVIFLFVTLLAATLQASVPGFASTGYAPLPFLLGVVIYYALTHRTSRMVQAAVLIGILDDSLGTMPLGFSSFSYAAIGLLIAHFRDMMTVRSVTTHAFLGAVSNFVITFVAWLVLVNEGELGCPWNWLVFKFAGAFVTGGLFVPLIFVVLYRLDHLMGRHEHHDEAEQL